MTDPLRVLVPVDGSARAEAILPALLPLLRSRASELTLLRVVREGEAADLAREALRALARALLLDGVRAVSRLEWGEPADEIEYLARPARHDILALTTRGLRSGTAAALLRRARIPLILNRPGTRVGDWSRIVVALDRALPADDLLNDVAPLARALGATVHLLHVNRPLYALSDIHKIPSLVPEPDPRPYLEGIRDTLAARGLLAVTATLPDRPAEGITRYAAETNAGLVAMLTHGRAGLARAFAGSVTEEVVRRSPVPVFVRRAEPLPALAKQA